eukprot:TRINITY_DN8454_c0_g2_i1.p1 TRINITY_DN8454_c0_g2~~TRINITY_DN8454_c0_g2_i1.p1  ORF type:complete len:172 (-),score=61.73 TRINITY_DN8454_c0_g2_i1:86-601(-)
MAAAEAEAAEAEERVNMSGDTESWLKNKSDTSELRQSVAKKGSNSYYYAHAAPNNGEQSEPTLISRIAAGEEVRVPKPVEKYLFMDDGQKVKVYVEMEGIGACKHNINCVFDFSEFDLTISDFNGQDFRLLVDDLQCPIVPEKSKIMVKPNKIVVVLYKEVRSTWYKLRKG